MPRDERVKLPDGRVWVVGSYVSPATLGAAVIVPINQLDGLTAEQIGQFVLSLVRPAELCDAEELVYHIENNDYNESQIRLEQAVQWLSKLEPFEEDSEEIAKTVTRLREIRDRRMRRVAAKAKAPGTRKEVQSKYDKLFVTIGRRDGFMCTQCKISASDLQIDHKIPVAEGGGNELDNLQLMCSTCNARKSDKIFPGIKII